MNETNGLNSSIKRNKVNTGNEKLIVAIKDLVGYRFADLFDDSFPWR